MSTQDRAQHGSFCWTDLWTSDTEGSRRFYSELFGWTAEEADPSHGGYFMFTRDGLPVAGAMGGNVGGTTPSNAWKIYVATDDVESSLKQAAADGAQIVGPAMPVDDLGHQAVVIDPTGAEVGLWQPGTFHGFSALDEHGAPSWFELHTRDFAGATAFYRSLFGWELVALEGDPGMAYSTVRVGGAPDDVAGILDIASEADVPSHWFTYWKVDDADAAATRVEELGGSVVVAPVDTPYGRLATVSDPTGAVFKLRQ